MRSRPLRQALLRQRLDELVATFDVSTISPDPLELARRYDDPLDQEVAGLIAAAFAYGRAETIVANVGGVLAKMGDSPFAYVKRLAISDWRLGEFTHRFHKTADLIAFLNCISAAIQKHGSLGELFRECYDDCDSDIGPSLARFVETLRSPNRQSLIANRFTYANGEGPIFTRTAPTFATIVSARPYANAAAIRPATSWSSGSS